MKDAYNQQDLAHKAKLEVELFQKAQDFAKEVGIQELKAKQFAKKLKESTDRAQKSRMIMFQAASQAKILSERLIKFISPVRCKGAQCPPSIIPPQVESFLNQNSMSYMNKLDQFNISNAQNVYTNIIDKINESKQLTPK